MLTNNILLAVSAVSFYLLATLLLFLRARSSAATHQSLGYGHLFPTSIAILLHLLLLSKVIFGENGLNFSFAANLTLCAWFTTLLSLAIAIRTKMPVILLVILPFSALSIVATLALPSHWSELDAHSLSLVVHIILSLFAYGLLSVAAIIAIMLAIQDFQLHHHQQGFFLKHLPALQTLEKLLFRLIEIGFLLLSFSVVSGFMFTSDLFNHKIVFSIIAWVVFFILLLGRHVAGWRGQTAIRWTLGGIAALMLAIFGTKIVLEYIIG